MVTHKRDEEAYKNIYLLSKKIFQPLYIIVKIVHNHPIYFRRWRELGVVEQQRRNMEKNYKI
jgi:hypothetical protein